MPVMIDGGRVPPCWSGKGGVRSGGTAERNGAQTECIRIALINNMPDSALEDTELQFLELLEAAAGEQPVMVKLYSLPEVPRGERGQQHLSKYYYDLYDLTNSKFDGVIVTGAEPRRPDLRDERYWPELTAAMDWAQRNAVSTVLSCLAAHAGVLYSDGISRQPLGDKCVGVFEHKKMWEHPLTEGVEEAIRVPHSRWNDLRESDLISAGYTILMKSLDAGVCLFAKKKGKCLFVHFQGHPEYQAQTLLKEYRRDVKRYLRQEREIYPSMPVGYFSEAAEKLMSEFQKRAQQDRKEEVLADFPEAAVTEALENTWHSSAARVYRNWLKYIAMRKSEAPAYAMAARVGRR